MSLSANASPTIARLILVSGRPVDPDQPDQHGSSLMEK